MIATPLSRIGCFWQHLRLQRHPIFTGGWKRVEPPVHIASIALKCCQYSTPRDVRQRKQMAITFKTNKDEGGIQLAPLTESKMDCRVHDEDSSPATQSNPQSLEIRKNLPGRNWADDLVEKFKLMSVKEWGDFKVNLKATGVVKDDNFESCVMLSCSRAKNFSLANSLMKFIEANGRQPNLVTLSKYMKICGQSKDGEVSDDAILEIYERLTKGGNLFDCTTAEDIIYGLCRTEKWKTSLEYLEMIRLTNRQRSPSALNMVIISAFRNGDCELGWQLLKEMVDHQLGPSDDVFVAWIEHCQKCPASEQLAMMNCMLDFVRDNEIIVGQKTAEQLKYVFENSLREQEEWSGTLTTVSERGLCKCCGDTLEDIDLGAEEFEELKNNFVEKVIEGNDLYLKSSPVELARFKTFVRCTAPYSVVIDALNVAYGVNSKYSNTFRLAQHLLTVVKNISRGNKNKVLVLGKQHMKLWPKKILDVIKREAIVFFTEDISKDDPYMMYAALCSGQGTLFVSKDMMRDHKYCFASDTRLMNLFRKWQRGHQIQIVNAGINGQIVVKPALKYNPVAQFAHGNWHIPYDDGSERYSYIIPNSWLCLRAQETPMKLNNLQVKSVSKLLKK